MTEQREAMGSRTSMRPEHRDRRAVRLDPAGCQRRGLAGRSVGGVLLEAMSAADNVSSGSQQLSAAAEELSQGASQQASSGEEAASSMEQMSAKNAKHNAENAGQTERIARQSAKDAEEVVRPWRERRTRCRRSRPRSRWSRRSPGRPLPPPVLLLSQYINHIVEFRMRDTHVIPMILWS